MTVVGVWVVLWLLNVWEAVGSKDFGDSPVYIRRENPGSAIIAQLDSKPRIMGSASLELNE